MVIWELHLKSGMVSKLALELVNTAKLKKNT